MKRLLSAALALSLLGGSAAVAAPYDHGNQGQNYGFSHQYRGTHRGHGDNGAAIAVGVGVLALAAILASQNHDRDRAYDRDGGQYRNDNGYDRGYDQNYSGGHGADRHE